MDRCVSFYLTLSATDCIVIDVIAANKYDDGKNRCLDEYHDFQRSSISFFFFLEEREKTSTQMYISKLKFIHQK